MFTLLLCLLGGVVLTGTVEVEKIERLKYSTWHLAMNLNPADGHVMDYTTGWVDGVFIGTYAEALKKDYLNRLVWRHPVSYIALVRHQAGEVDAVKVFRFKEGERSLRSRFQAMNPGREVVTEGGPIQESVSNNALNMGDDPIFSVGGDLAFNWAYNNCGTRIALTGGYLAGANESGGFTHGLGNHLACNPLRGTASQRYKTVWNHEIANIREHKSSPPFVQGTDHGTSPTYVSGPVYGNYAIYVSKDGTSFLEPGQKLDIEHVVKSKYKFF